MKVDGNSPRETRNSRVEGAWLSSVEGLQSCYIWVRVESADTGRDTVPAPCPSWSGENVDHSGTNRQIW